MQTRAFILDAKASGEYDRTYLLLTQHLGLIEAFAKSVRKSNAKLSGHLEPPNLSWVELVESNRGWQLTSALEENSYHSILSSPGALRTALIAGWLLHSFIPVSYPDQVVWDLWQEFLERLSQDALSSPATQRGILAQFLIKLLAHLGFFPAPEDIAPPGKLRQKLNAILEGAWLDSRSSSDPALWEIVKQAVKTAQRLMR
jgi:recombinational DNA repair protein (RecF pathway)